MDVPQQSASFLRMPCWKVISSLFWISLVAFLSWFCAGFNAWSLEDAGNATLSNDSYYVYRVSFLITFIFSFCLLWIRFKARFLIPVFIAMGVGAFAMFFSLQNAELQRKLVILERYQSIREALNSKNWEAAYLLMSPEYREEHTVKEFEEDILLLIDTTYLSEPDWVQEINIHAIHPSGTKAWLVPERRISKDFHPSYGVGWNLVKVHGQWYFEAYPNFFID